IDNLKIKTGTSQEIPAKFEVNEDFCRLLGYYIAEGNIGKNKRTVQITNSERTVQEDVRRILKNLNLNYRIRETRGLGKSVQIIIDCSPLAKLLLKLGAGRVSSEKRIPSFVYGLNERKICALLRGMYTGDGSFTASKSSGNAVGYYTTSKKLAEDMMYLLLTLSIVARLETKKRSKVSIGKKPVYNVTFKQKEFIRIFFQKIGFNRTYVPPVLERGVEHTKDNSVKFEINELEKHLKLPRKYRHIRRYSQCGKNYLKKIASETKCSKQFEDYANGEFYLDTIKEIKEIILPEEEYVYDLSVNPTENFIGGFGGIVLHNTEAFALYEAMRIGALANVVAGTIHGDSPYGVFDRVVNDLKVPPTSFKATDIIMICNPIKSPDGLKKWRRVMSITEVRKHWSDDPIREQGFVDLMKYNSKTDQLEPTDDLINGESETLKSIGGNVKEWAGDWDAIWDNITLRAKIKETIVKYAEKTKDMGLLEAEFVVLANDHFHRVSGMIKEEVGNLDSKRIFFEWDEWMKRKIRERKLP
ncbi:MAG: LAGLIDADG family homing endonuclease, partial [Nanoarchaeota archaeon]|nr:LAGLIDADG family homing endonuclease [Nanoarchaeota archaeon]